MAGWGWAGWVGRGKNVNSCGGHGQITGKNRIVASLHSILRKEVQRDTLSQASMPLATMPETLAFTAFLPDCTAYCARMWSKTRCHKRIKPWPASAGSVRPDKVSFGVGAKRCGNLVSL